MTCSCRHYAVLAVSIFRHHGVPSRVRVGYATYFTSGFYEDHWVCEYWNVPRDRFLTAGDAWRAVRDGTIDGERCGVSRIPAARGAVFVGANILRDLAALNGHELLPWDYFGIAREWGRRTVISPVTAARLDELAALTTRADSDWQAVRAAYEQAPDLRVSPTVRSYPEGGPVEVPV